MSDNDSWEQFAYHFDQIHGDYFMKLSKANVRLSPREIKLVAFKLHLVRESVNLFGLSSRDAFCQGF
jgi:hypothetical protein